MKMCELLLPIAKKYGWGDQKCIDWANSMVPGLWNEEIPQGQEEWFRNTIERIASEVSNATPEECCKEVLDHVKNN